MGGTMAKTRQEVLKSQKPIPIKYEKPQAIRLEPDNKNRACAICADGSADFGPCFNGGVAFACSVGSHPT